MDATLKNRISPHTSPQSVDYSAATVKSATAKVVDEGGKDKVNFKDVLLNSNIDQAHARAAQKNGDGMTGAKTDEEFAKAMLDRANKDQLRKPSNSMDKDSFLKLFITQMQNQDPLNPDNSAEMAAQLAQFNGLEQMLNVNKNLEKMMGEQQMGRAVTLLNFVGKDVKLDNGKLKLDHGKVDNAVFNVDTDAPKATLEIRDAAGAVVSTQDLGALRKGEHKVDWNGVNKEGVKVQDGVYTFNVVAKDLNDQEVPVRVTSTARVTGVDLKDEGGSFYTELGKVRVNEIASVGALGFGDKAKAAVGATDKKKEDGAADQQGNGEEDGVAPAGAPPPVTAAPEQSAEAEPQRQAQPPARARHESAPVPSEMLNAASPTFPPAISEIPIPGAGGAPTSAAPTPMAAGR
jgi:flagellar basal-body rod modification protein FlgD